MIHLIYDYMGGVDHIQRVYGFTPTWGTWSDKTECGLLDFTISGGVAGYAVLLVPKVKDDGVFLNIYNSSGNMLYCRQLSEPDKYALNCVFSDVFVS